MHQFACPHCGARLRVKDKSFAGRTVKCPDCHEPVAIRAGPGGDLFGEAGATASSTGREPRTTSRRTILAATAAALVIATALIVASPRIFSPGADPGGAIVVDDAPEGANPPATPDPAGEPDPAAANVAARLTDLGRQITAYAAEHQTFPAPAAQPRLPPEQRLSWLAVLLATTSGEVAPDAEHGWHDPANDPFTRRAIDALQNPALETRAGPAGHPVGHFAGIAGVGADAPLLPVNHPRAGVFGFERTTRVPDIRDGQANTLMVAGVQDQFESWAANGPATIRPLTAEPYIGGPDSFGTAEQGGMSVLMADGSVRFLASDTDPRLLRRMAAMADGLPLDVSVPGEPGEATPAAPPVAIVEPVEPAPPEAGPDTEPIDVPVAADPVFDIDAALDQPIAEFHQPTPRKVGELLKLVGELAGVPIDTSQLDAAAIDRLETKTALSLQATTVRGVLDASVEPAGLTYSFGNGVVVLLNGAGNPVEN